MARIRTTRQRLDMLMGEVPRFGVSPADATAVLLINRLGGNVPRKYGCGMRLES
jgi:hypothetical protein